MERTSQLIDNFAIRTAEWSIRNRYLIIALTLFSAFAIGYGMQMLTFATNYRVFFSKENPELLAFEDFQNTYTKNDNFLFVLQPKDGKVFTPQIAEAIEKMTEKSWQIPFSIRVDSISNFQHTWANEDDLTVEDLIKDGKSMPLSELKRRKAIALAEPLLVDNLLARDAETTGINVTLQYPEKALSEVPEAAAFARNMVEELERDYPDITVALTGLSMMNNAFAESGLQDSQTLLPIMYLTLIIVMLVSLRSLSATFATVLVIAFSCIVAMGAAGFAGIQLTPISMSAPTIILTLAIADSIHILISMREAMRDGMEKRAALVEALRVNFLAIGITSLTTIVGFLSLNFSDAPPFNHLGNMTAVGILAAWVYSILFLPAVMSFMPMKVRADKTNIHGKTSMEQFADWVIAKHKTLLVVMGGSAIFLIAMLPTIDLNDQWTKYFDESIEFRRDTDFALEHLGGLYTIEFSIPASEPGAISDPEYLQPLDKFVDWMRQQPEVTHIFSITDIMKRLNKNMHGDDEAYYRIPDDRELSAQYLLLYELSLPYGLDLNDRINIDKSATRVTATLGDVTTVGTRDFIARAENWMAANAPEYMTTNATGATMMFSYIAKRNIDSMLRGNAFAVIIISIIMILTLRSFSMGALSLIPNTIPILMTFGLWAILVNRVGLAAAIVSVTSLGIIVDDTVHFLTKYLRGRREKNLDTPDAIRYAFRTVGKAIIVNSIILAFGFMVLASSSFKPNYESGALTAIAVIVAVIVDFLLLPALLLMFSRERSTPIKPTS